MNKMDRKQARTREGEHHGQASSETMTVVVIMVVMLFKRHKTVAVAETTL